jgi:hypothetical protein
MSGQSRRRNPVIDMNSAEQRVAARLMSHRIVAVRRESTGGQEQRCVLTLDDGSDVFVQSSEWLHLE